jgi:hypothetical protein
MIYAYIKSESGDTIGTINEESNGFRVVWRTRPDDSTVNTHSTGAVLHASTESARQEVYKTDSNAMVIRARE